MNRQLLTYVIACSLGLMLGCSQSSDSSEKNTAKNKSADEPTENVQAKQRASANVDEDSATKDLPAEPQAIDAPDILASKRLTDILTADEERVKARLEFRRPKETLSFFGLLPGMTVVEALPGRGWYSKILLPFLGSEGKLIGADYAAEMYPLFGFFSEQQLKEKKTWVKSWTNDAEQWRGENSATLSAFQFGSMPSNMEGKADAVVFIRALHNLNRFESQGEYMSKALKDTYRILKPGGIVGVVQHMAPETHSDDWANGANGYLKKDFVIKRLEKAGFEFVKSSDINVNPKDKPTEKDMVWRLSPSFVTSRDNPKLKEKIGGIGESSRMTLVFRKPFQE